MKNAVIPTLGAALLLTCEIAVAQNLAKKGDASIALPGPLASRHFSTGKLDAAQANTQAIAREMADSLTGQVEQPMMTPTRSSFLAKWPTAVGASGYRLDVSTTPSFEKYLPGYRDRDLGNVTSHIVSGLERGTEYFYRVRPYDAAGGIGADSETTPAATASTNAGLVIVPSFDPTITSDPRSNAIQAMIVSTIQAYQALFSDPITVTIYFRLSAFEPDGMPMGIKVGASNSVCYPRDWNAFITALKADAKTASDAAANATLPTTALATSILTRSAGGRAIGLNTPPAMFADAHLDVGGPYDGVITINSSVPLQFTRPVSPDNYDARTFTEHEIDEVLGLGSHLGSVAPQFLCPHDLFSWASLNARNTSETGERHFSIDRGLHFIATFNRDPAGDLGDWESEPQCPQNHPLVQNAFNCDGQSPEISATSPEGVSLDVIGYDLVTSSPGNAGVFGNISTRLPVGTGNNILIAGFQVTGNTPKQLVVRGIGPSLAQFGLTNVLPDPTLELHDSSGAIIESNDDWQDAANAQAIPTALRPTNGLEPVIFTTLNRGAYTAVLRGYNGSTGTGLVEVYDTSVGNGTQLGNISTRGFVQSGDNVMIAGLVVQSQTKQVVVRALGPTLAGFGVNNALPDPTLSLYDGNGGLLIFNDDWRDTQESSISGSGLAPRDDLESAIAGTVAPGSYTAVVRGYENAVGNALIEVYGVN